MKTLIKLTCLTFLSAGLTISSFSQIWTSYTKESTLDQLCSNQINCIVVDEKNNKWFGTDKGISMFDGVHWISYDTTSVLPDNQITSGAIDMDGIIWFGTISGSVVKYDGKEWTSFISKTQLPGDKILSIAVDKENNKWFGANRCQLSVFDNNLWKQNFISDFYGYNTDAYDTKAIAFDSKGYQWIGYTSCDWGHIISFDTDFHYYACPNDLISCISIDKNDNIWVGSAFGIIKYKNDQLEKFDNINNQHWSHVSSIYIDDDNTKWIGTIYGLARFDDYKWTNFTTENGLIGNSIYTIAKDHDGNLWIGTDCGISVSKFINTEVAENSLPTEQITIYPNPANNVLNIESSLLNCDLTVIKIVNQLGQVCYSKIFEDYQQSSAVCLDVSNLIKGLYILQIKSGHKYFSEKVEIF
jgi:ligand-binding sensor domain-containing protein